MQNNTHIGTPSSTSIILRYCRLSFPERSCLCVSKFLAVILEFGTRNPHNSYIESFAQIREEIMTTSINEGISHHDNNAHDHDKCIL